jgi:AAA+ superfamily predicted ATPase
MTPKRFHSHNDHRYENYNVQRYFLKGVLRLSHVDEQQRIRFLYYDDVMIYHTPSYCKPKSPLFKKIHKGMDASNRLLFSPKGKKADSPKKKPQWVPKISPKVERPNLFIATVDEEDDDMPELEDPSGNKTMDDVNEVRNLDNDDMNENKELDEIDDLTKKIENEIANIVVINRLFNSIRTKDASASTIDISQNDTPSKPPATRFKFPMTSLFPVLKIGLGGLGEEGLGAEKMAEEGVKKKLPIEWTDDELGYEFAILEEKADTVDDLIRIGKLYKEKYEPMKKRFNLNVRVLELLVEPLEELQKMIGMDAIKTAIYEKIILYLQGIENRNRDFLHTVLYGGPGMGKTEVAKIIGKIYAKMGLLSKGDFKEVRLTDLKAGYVGQSELKTQKVLDDAKGCVLFMDEAYSLGSDDKFDQFSQGIIDIINPYMDKYKDDFVFIVAGYRDELEHRFFKGNQGLKSRFGLWLEIDKYNGEQLRSIFLKKVADYGWTCKEEEIKAEFFEKNKKMFPFYGRDIDVCFSKCKIAHAKRVLYLRPEDKKILTGSDLEEGFKIYQKDRDLNKKDTEFERIKAMMYM